MVRKYLTSNNIKIEDQIRYRFAVWLLNTKDYLEVKITYLNESKETIPVIKHTTGRRGNISKHIRWIKRKFYFHEEHKNRMETLDIMRNNLVSEYNDISVSFS